MSTSTAQKIVDYVLCNQLKDEKIQIAFFGGEPLLQFDLVKEIASLVTNHRLFRPGRVGLSLTTNGTIISDEITDFFIENNITPCVSCDGPAQIHDSYRRFPNGHGSSALVEKNIRKLVNLFPLLQVNAVYSPETLQSLPDVVKYLTSLGVKNLILSYNISAKWFQKEADMLPEVYALVGKQFVDFYSQGTPKYISLIDNKIAAILRGGHKPFERCRMGRGELAFSPSGELYPCERLVNSCNSISHRIGDVNAKLRSLEKNKPISSAAKNPECLTCELSDYCINWCGCSNFFATGNYDRVGPFVCASEKASLAVASQILFEMKDKSSVFAHHMNGTPLMNIIEAA